MNIFHKVTLQTLKKNKTRTMVTVIGIILSAAMICAVTTFTVSFRNFLLENAIYTEGSWHGKAEAVSYETVKDVKNNPQIDCAQGVQVLGYSELADSQNEFKPYLYVLGAEADAQSMLPIHIIAGRFPQKSGEILLPEHLASNGGVIHKLGDTLDITLGNRILEGEILTQHNPAYGYDQLGREVPNGEVFVSRENRSYQVVGFYERPNYEIEGYTAPGYTAITLADSTPASGSGYDLYYRMNNSEDVYSFMMENGIEGNTNQSVLMVQGTFKYDSFHKTLVSLAAIVIGLIVFGSVALIYNAFSISMSERTKQFGLLSSVGATQKQLSGMIRYEALIVSVIGIPIGILSGIGGIGLTFLLLRDKFNNMGNPVFLKLHVSVVSIVIAAVIALITVLISAWIPSRRARKVSAVEAIRQNADIKINGRQVKTGKLTYKLFGLPGTLAKKYYKRSKKKYRATIISLFMSIVLFVSAYSFTQYMAESMTMGFGNSQCDLCFVLNEEERGRFTNQDVLNLMKAQQTVTKAASLSTRFDTAFIESDELTEKIRGLLSPDASSAETGKTHFDVAVSFVDDATYLEFLIENHLYPEKFTDPDTPRAIALESGATFNPENHRYEYCPYLQNPTSTLEIETIKQIPGYHMGGYTTDEQGNESVIYYSKTYEGDTKQLPAGEVVSRRVHQIAAVFTDRPYFVSSDIGLVLLYPESALPVIYPDWISSENGAEFLILSSDHVQCEKDLKVMLMESGLRSNNLTDVAAYQESSRNTATVIRVFCFGFIILISLISAANVFNTISTNVSLRRRDLAMLRSVGMTQKGFNRLMCYECLLYGSKSLLYGIPAALLVTALIWQSVSGSINIGFRIPWIAMGIAVFSVFLVVFATMRYAMKKVNSNNLLETLRNENL